MLRQISLSTLLWGSILVMLPITHASTNETLQSEIGYANIYTATADVNVTIIDPTITSLFSASQVYQYEATTSAFLQDVFTQKRQENVLNCKTILLQMTVKDQERLTLIPRQKRNSTSNSPAYPAATSQEDMTAPPAQKRSRALLLSSRATFVYNRDRPLPDDGKELLVGLLEKEKAGFVAALTAAGVVGNGGDVPTAILINHGSQPVDELSSETYFTVEPYVMLNDEYLFDDDNVDLDSSIEDTEKEVPYNDTSVNVTTELSDSTLKTSLPHSEWMTTSLSSFLGMNEGDFLHLCIYALSAMVGFLSIALVVLTCRHRRNGARKNRRVSVDNAHGGHNGLPLYVLDENSNRVNPNPNLGACPRVHECELQDVHITPERKMGDVDKLEMTPMGIEVYTPIRTPSRPLGIATLRSLEMQQTERLTPPPSGNSNKAKLGDRLGLRKVLALT